MKLISIQIALFSAEQVFRPDLLMNAINEKLGNILDDMPTILNIPVDVPADIPIVQAKSQNKIYALNISRNRVDFFISPKYFREESPFEIYKSYKSTVEKYYKTVMNALQISRIGIVFTLFEETGEEIKRIYDKYLKESVSAKNVEVNIRTNTQTLSKGFVINNLRTVQAANVTVDASNKKGVLFQLDTNNAVDPQTVDPPKILSAENIADILSTAISRIKPNAIKELI